MERQIKTTMKYDLTATRMATTTTTIITEQQQQKITSVSQYVEKFKFLCTIIENVECYSHCG